MGSGRQASSIRAARVRLTEPAIAPIRRVVPPMGGLDFSPMILLLALRLLRGLFKQHLVSGQSFKHCQT